MFPFSLKLCALCVIARIQLEPPSLHHNPIAERGHLDFCAR